MRCIKFCPSILRFWFSECCKHSTVYRFFASERREITTRFSDMIPNLASTLQLQMLASHCCKILSDGKDPCNELMLHHTRQCTGAGCKMLQMLRGLEILTANPWPKYCSQMLSHRGASTKACFYTDVCTYTCVYPEMVLHKHLHAQVFYTRVLLHKNIYTQTCRYF